jgi:hypothetical protein
MPKHFKSMRAYKAREAFLHGKGIAHSDKQYHFIAGRKYQPGKK